MNKEAEQAVICSFIIDNECVALVSDILKPEMFLDCRNQKLYEDCLALSDIGSPINTLFLRDKGTPAEYLGVIAEAACSSATVEWQAKLVLEEFKKSEIQKLGIEINRISRDDRCSEEMLVDVERAVKTYTEHDITQEIEHAGEIAKTISFETGGSERIPTGFRAIDDIIIGICKTDYMVVAGRPGMGKTSLMVDIATNLSWGNGRPTAFYSCEMSPEQIVSRMASARSSIPLYSVEKGFATQDQRDLLYEAAKQMRDCPIYIKSTGGLTPLTLKRKIMADKRKYGIELAFVDYLQLMQPDGGSRSQYEDITRISRAIKQVVLQTGIPIVMGSQLKRIEEAKRPKMTDFRGSGAIEEDTDIIIGLHRPSYYTPGEPDSDAEAIIIKGRHFGTGIAELSFIGNLTHFTDTI